MLDAIKIGLLQEIPAQDMPELPVIHMVESDDYRARLLMKHFNNADERGRRLMLQQAAAVAKLCTKEGG